MLRISSEQSPGRTSSIHLRTVNDLLGNSFLIPPYQRGFRWSKQQVRELLEDVLAFQFSDEGRSREGFYCLQPIVVKAASGNSVWEVVDGQQRLTTLFLILQYFNQRLAEKFRRELYTIDFETRPGSKAYLSEPTKERSEEYIDFYFIYLAKSTIEQWFENKDHLVNDFEAALLNRVKVIWYQLPETENAIDAFTRLNVGKIPLNDAELVRALFLRSKNFPQVTANLEQLKIAQEWDGMEKALQNDDFWFFLTDDTGRPNRIELIFDFITEANLGETRPPSGTYVSFHHFNDLLSQEGTKPQNLWDKVKQYFMTLEEWYRDEKLFHLIGYLINEGDRVLTLIQLSKSQGKTAFRKLLKQRILAKLMPIKERTREELQAALREFLGNLEYGTHSATIKSVLLLFNIASIVANDKSIVRFRFDYFKRQSWDIEHIRSVDSGRPTANVDKRSWLETVRGYFKETGENQALRSRAEEMIALRSYTMGDAFDLLYNDIIRHFNEHESTEADNGLGNLALLDSGTNRGYKNAVFPIKRRRLLQLDQEGTFVPLCTRNAFLKCYSEKVENMFFWGVEDQADYRNAIVKTLADFFSE